MTRLQSCSAGPARRAGEPRRRHEALAVGVTAEIKNRLSVVDVVGKTVALKKAGSTYKGLCPFHAERTPSFVVTPGRETWHCFGCGKHGDIFSFVMERDGLSFPDALRTHAAEAGVELDERTRRDDAHRRRLREVLEAAIAFYHAVLTGSKAGQPALDYLRGRGFSDATIERFQLGWAPPGWDTLARTLERRRGIGPAELAEVGLITSRPGGRGAYDRFRARVIFPIRDVSGGAVGLGGRLLADDPEAGPKYLNSPATPLFDKSRTLYLIDRAKGPIRRSGQAVIVEGYTDALIAHQAGFENVVASLGTALTPAQVELLARYARRIVLAYDVDPAGERAGTLGATELNALIGEIQASGAGIGLTDVGVVRLPAGKDPDEVIRESPDAWRAATSQPQDIVTYLIESHAGRVDVRTAEGRKRLVDAVLPTLRRVADPIVRDAYVQELARRASVDERSVREALAARVARSPGRSPGGTPGGEVAGRFTVEAVIAAGGGVTPEDLVRSVQPVEAELLRLLLLLPELQPRAADQLRPEQLPTTIARELYRAILADRARDLEAGGPGRFDPRRMLETLDPETRALAEAIYRRPGPDPSTLGLERAALGVDQCVLRLERAALEARQAWTQAEIAEAERRGDGAALAELMERDRELHDALRSIHRRIEQVTLLARTSGGSR